MHSLWILLLNSVSFVLVYQEHNKKLPHNCWAQFWQLSAIVPPNPHPPTPLPLLFLSPKHFRTQPCSYILTSDRYPKSRTCGIDLMIFLCVLGAYMCCLGCYKCGKMSPAYMHNQNEDINVFVSILLWYHFVKMINIVSLFITCLIYFIINTAGCFLQQSNNCCEDAWLIIGLFRLALLSTLIFHMRYSPYALSVTMICKHKDSHYKQSLDVARYLRLFWYRLRCWPLPFQQ